MVKLRIFRGEALHADVELTGQTARIGRSRDNEIVLEDPGKGVSRTHAEIRFEGGRYVLVDNRSQNGIWVSGSRVSSVVLAPDVVASLGPFRLTIEQAVGQAAEVAADTHTEVIQRSDIPRSQLPVEGESKTSEPPAPSPPEAEVLRTRRWFQQSRRWILAGAAVLLITATGLAIYKYLRIWRPPFDLVVAKQLVDRGDCQKALVDHIDPALRADATDATALELKSLCTPPPPPPPDPPPDAGPPHAPAAAPLLNEAEALIMAKDCQMALAKINEVLLTDATNERARALAERANACLSQRPPPAQTAAMAIKRPPSEGGLEPLPKELEKDYRTRMQAMRARYDTATSMLQRGEHVNAARELEQIGREVPNGYLDLTQRLETAQQGIRDEAKNRFEAAQAAEARDDFDAANDAYRRAHELDPGLQIDEPIKRIANKKLQLGKKYCEAGKLEFSYGANRAAAIAFQEAVRLLPPSDPCYAIAQGRLKQLGK